MPVAEVLRDIQFPGKVSKRRGESSWDPYASTDWDEAGTPDPDVIKRIKRFGFNFV